MFLKFFDEIIAPIIVDIKDKYVDKSYAGIEESVKKLEATGKFTDGNGSE